jgi:hypothetical protein
MRKKQRSGREKGRTNRAWVIIVRQRGVAMYVCEQMKGRWLLK